MFYCKLCEYVAKLRYDVIRHVESKHLDLKYTCYYCNAILKTKRSYQNHLRHYHPNQHHANIQWITEFYTICSDMNNIILAYFMLEHSYYEIAIRLHTILAKKIKVEDAFSVCCCTGSNFESAKWSCSVFLKTIR